MNEYMRILLIVGCLTGAYISVWAGLHVFSHEVLEAHE